jgi:phosphopantetheinyl transferase (holo-ACP synthase)
VSVLMRRNGGDGWLALVLRDAGQPLHRGRARREADERAAARARRIALAACGTTVGRATISVSHTEGSAAALVGRQLLGVDLVRMSRVTPRHARAILTAADWSALDAIPGPCRAALGWALKEAAAKATGVAQHFFPTRVGLVRDPCSGSLRARLAGPARTSFDTDWMVLGELLCATVVISQLHIPDVALGSRKE